MIMFKKTALFTKPAKHQELKTSTTFLSSAPLSQFQNDLPDPH